MSQTIGSKGSDVYTDTGSAILTLSLMLVRGASFLSIDDAIQLITSPSDLVNLIVLMFHVRNIRGGKGERDISFNVFVSLYQRKPDLMLKLLDLFPLYGCWSDLLTLCQSIRDSKFQDAVLNLFATQLLDDSMKPDKELTLCAKWAPKERKSNHLLARALALKLYPVLAGEDIRNSLRKYRILVSSINGRLKTVEIAMSARKFASINPSTVPGRAGKLYARAFLNLVSTFRGNTFHKLTPLVINELRHPENGDRMICRSQFQEHFAKAKEGKAKVHGVDTLFPHELVKKAYEDTLTDSEKDQLVAVWRNMVEKAKEGGGLGRSIFMCDFSGSMQSSTQGDLPYWVSLALGMLGSEVCCEFFRNMILTFDSTPTIHRFPDGDLFERMNSIRRGIGQGTSTDFQAAMNLLAEIIKKQRIKPGQEPENIIVLTDMNWDTACSSNETSVYTGNTYRHHVKTEAWQTHLEMIKETFKRMGEDMWGTLEHGGLGGFKVPRIVIWNLSAGSTDFHAKFDTPGVSMLSGWSPTQFSVLQKLGPQQVSPLETLETELNHPRYDCVRERIADLQTFDWVI